LSFEWHKGFEKLKEYVAREDTARVPASFKTDDGFPLGSWVRNRGKEYKNNKLDADKVAMLEALPGWVWKAMRLTTNPNNKYERMD
jgi:hypothetical protein